MNTPSSMFQPRRGTQISIAMLRPFTISATPPPGPLPEAERGSKPFGSPSPLRGGDRKSTRLNSSHSQISYAVFCLKKKIIKHIKVFMSLQGCGPGPCKDHSSGSDGTVPLSAYLLDKASREVLQVAAHVRESRALCF